MSISTQIHRAMSLVVIIASVTTPEIFARGRNIDASVDRLMDSFNEYSKQTGGKMTAEQRMQKRKEIIEPAHRAMRQDFFAVTRAAMDHRGVKIYKSLEAARAGSGSDGERKLEAENGRLKITKLDAEGKPIGKGTIVGMNSGNGPGNAVVNARKKEVKSGEVSTSEEPEVVVSGEQDVKRMSFPGKKKK